MKTLRLSKERQVISAALFWKPARKLKVEKILMQKNEMIEFLSRISYRMTEITNIFTGVGVVVRVEITGKINNQTAVYCATLIHENTAIAAGLGVGSIAKLLLEDKLKHPGVLPVEAVLPTDLFKQNMQEREIEINSFLRFL